MKNLIRAGWLLAILILLTACSTFESFSFRLPIELAYGDTAVQAEQAADVARIESDRDVMLSTRAPHTVEVKFPGEMTPAVGPPIEDPPPVMQPNKGMAMTEAGVTLYDCIAEKGTLVSCHTEPGQ